MLGWVAPKWLLRVREIVILAEWEHDSGERQVWVRGHIGISRKTDVWRSTYGLVLTSASWFLFNTPGTHEF